MAAVTVSLGTTDGVALSITFDDRTGVLSKVTVTNNQARAVTAVVGALGASPYVLRTKTGGAFTVPAVQPAFLLDADKRPTNLVHSVAVCGCAAAH